MYVCVSESVCLCAGERMNERKRESVCVCVCVFARVCEHDRVSEKLGNWQGRNLNG